jgi:predicted lactoylglutathione lyase
MAELSYVNIFARDIEGLCRFYVELFGFPEIPQVRSPIFRAVQSGTCRIGFNAVDAYQLLNLADRADTKGVKFMLTVEVGSAEEVDRLVAVAQTKRASVVKEPYRTAYKSYQAVLFDPEGNVVRINANAG